MKKITVFSQKNVSEMKTNNIQPDKGSIRDVINKLQNLGVNAELCKRVSIPENY
ncbi:hypothetical protein SM124_05970 [Bacillus sp. 31A1R]|uniref:Uncharacterized protein n=1 Tax=Robertmurraya mangrovi TaxID=3098077 RepID=A0ABU5IVV4_9BACI|nr:hypothetical protein [Bacillus sp. 31A1R]MDZ5471289.1 hypothetical protein [Bacillus sp. 31A1R]